MSTNDCSFGEDCLNNPHIMSQLLDQLEGDTHIIMSYYCDSTKDDMVSRTEYITIYLLVYYSILQYIY